MTTENEDYRRGYREAKHKYFNAQKTLEHWKAVVTEDGPEGEEYARLIHGHIHDALNLHPDYLPHEHDDDEDCVVLAELPSTRDLIAKFLHEDVRNSHTADFAVHLDYVENTQGETEAHISASGLQAVQRTLLQQCVSYEDLDDASKAQEKELADKLLMLLEE